MTAAGDDNSFIRIAEWFVSAGAGLIGGVLIALVAYRTKLSDMARDTADAKREAAEAKADALAKSEEAKAVARQLVSALEGVLDKRAENLESRLDLIERRGFETLRITVDIAKHLGLDNRINDTMLRMLGDTNGADHE